MTTNPTPDSNADRELRLAILKFDKARGQTGADYVNGKITRQQADSEYEEDISDLIMVFRAQEAALLSRIEKEVIGTTTDATALLGSTETAFAMNRLREGQRAKLDNIAKEIRGEGHETETQV